MRKQTFAPPQSKMQYKFIWSQNCIGMRGKRKILHIIMGLPKKSYILNSGLFQWCIAISSKSNKKTKLEHISVIKKYNRGL